MRRVTVETDELQMEADRVSTSLAGLAFALFLVVIGLFLVQRLAHKAQLEDCLLSGRLNCDQMLTEVR